MAADVESIALVTQAALPYLLERGGSVMNVASVAGLGGDYAMTSYHAASGLYHPTAFIGRIPMEAASGPRSPM